MTRTPRGIVERLVADVTPGTLEGRVQIAQPAGDRLRRPDRGGERTSMALQVVGGRWLFIQNTAPSDGESGDLWISTAVGERAKLRWHDGTGFVAD